PSRGAARASPATWEPPSTRGTPWSIPGARPRQAAVLFQVHITDSPEPDGSPQTLAASRSTVVFPVEVGPARSTTKFGARSSRRSGGARAAPRTNRPRGGFPAEPPQRPPPPERPATPQPAARPPAPSSTPPAQPRA